MGELVPWKEQKVVDLLDEYIGTNDSTWDIVLAQIPGLFGQSDKANYLGFRALGFPAKQAIALCHLDQDTLVYWQRDYPVMFEFEKEHLIELQQRVGADVVRLAFLRNMTMFLFRDGIVLQKALMDPEGMSDRDFSYLKAVHRHYTTADLLNLEKAIAPDKHRDNVIQLSWQNNHIEIVDGQVSQTVIPEVSHGTDD